MHVKLARARTYGWHAFGVTLGVDGTQCSRYV